MLAAAALAACLCAVQLAAFAQPPALTASEYSVKAAYLYKFPAYVQWPEGRFETPDAPLTIGVFGTPELAEELLAITAGRRIDDRPIRVRRVTADDALGGIDVLFVGREEASRMERVAAAAEEESILTVTDAEPGPPGAVINFVAVDGRVRFEVFLDAAERRGLRLSSGLLSVAERVHRSTP